MNGRGERYIMNEERFTGMGNIYSKYRPNYPKELFDYLYSAKGFTDKSVIADIGAGTGIFSKSMLMRGSKVFCVEPNADMRNVAEKYLTDFSNSKCIFVNAPAESTSLPDLSIDFITVAQAFHWFDKLKFKAECRRIMKSSGEVVLTWNSRDEESNLIAENDEINRKFCKDFRGFSGGMRGGSPEEFADFFDNGIYETRVFENNLVLDEAGFIGRNLSSSYSPKESDANHGEYIEELKQLFKKYAVNGSLDFPYITKSYSGEV